MRKRKYTERIHASRLLKMLEKKNPCLCCPAAVDFNGSECPKELWKDTTNPCDICMNFVGASNFFKRCPCHNFGQKQAIKTTWIALEEKGYI